MASLSLEQGSFICQILFSSLIILDILAATNTILPTIANIFEQKEEEENRTELNLNMNSNEHVVVQENHQRGVDIALGVAEIAALAILIICNITALR